ncbi:hypothetical protein E0Z10_g3567 [Xylaria hypoxylon]|uniref:Uncharacterized protein n=1 Tax=Xylaria hypoxylon TaxID=37992 RepID=A0A4Z0Z0H3_9PEZI|nr:hypothetical protein E0Z10_g3567 [Xylaria hypoxylon]
MGHQESSPPRQRHRVPHHRRHRHHHYHNSAAQTTNHKSSLNLGRLNREFHAPNSHVVVENWLGQLTTPAPTARLVLPESRNQSVQHRKHPRSQDSHGSSGRQRRRRADRLWRPQHIPPAQGSSPPRIPPPINPQRNSKRYKRNSGDSSLISDLSPRRELRGWVSTEATSEHEESLHYKPLDEVEVATVTSSPTSHIGMVEPAFEKRPRHKTRADKYDTKKPKDRKRSEEQRDQDKYQPRVSKSKKRKHVVTGKNVMRNFNSGAVTNDRITIQPNLKPGLFNNKRVPKDQAIADLSFSEMPFPTHQERDIPQQKGLSGSRLRERRRENRELEQISSFFLPSYVDATSRKPKRAKFKGNEETKSKQLIYGNDGRDSFTTPSSPAMVTQSHRQQFLTSPENSCSSPPATPSGPDCCPTLSKTTYFTWSSSQHSPQARNYPVSTRPESVEPAKSATPEDIREALAITGVYKNTGIHSYNVSNDRQEHASEALGESSPIRSSVVGQRAAYEGRILATDHKPKMKPRCSNDTRATVAQLTHIEKRWNTILPPKWRLRRASEPEVSPVDKQQEDVVLDGSRSAGLPSRQEMAQQARVKPMREIPPAHHTYHYGDRGSNTNTRYTIKSPVSVSAERDRIEDHAVSADQDRATIASRDAMPPPPIPPVRFDSLHTPKPQPEHDFSSSIRIETARPLETHVQVPNCEQPEIMDSYNATGQRCELGGVSEKVISRLDSLSWIPQAVTSNIVSYDRDKTLSRLSMRSPIYHNQTEEINSQGASHLTLSPTAHMNESMADFIARIESELDESTSLDEYYQPESIREDREFSLDSVSTYDMQNRQLTALDGIQVDCPRLPIDAIDDFEFEDVFETGENLHDYKELETSVRDRPTTMPTEGQRDDFDEFLEMSRFWRPNRFSHL